MPFASIRGLSQADVEARLKTEGYNELPRPDRRTPLRMSPLSRGRGLKRIEVNSDVTARLVAPLAGAWIETRTGSAACGTTESPLSRVRGLKPTAPYTPPQAPGRPSRGA